MEQTSEKKPRSDQKREKLDSVRTPLFITHSKNNFVIPELEKELKLSIKKDREKVKETEMEEKKPLCRLDLKERVNLKLMTIFLMWLQRLDSRSNIFSKLRNYANLLSATIFKH